MTSGGVNCPECGATRRPGASRGLCPRCLLRVALADVSDADLAGENADNSSAFGDFDLIREIGRGGMGVVYEARERALHRVVALKMLLPARLASSAQLQRFKLEAEAIASLDHPNLLPVYTFGEIAGQPYFSMKLAESGSLADRMRPGAPSISETEAAGWISQIARAIHYTHQRGIQHRDLKPANILLDSTGKPFVSDFGLAKFNEQDAGLTLSTDVLGSPAYMPPEQAAGKMKEMTTAADIYSLGAILYELLAGRPPFVGESVPGLLRQIAEEEPAPLRSIRPSISRDLEIICLKCLNKEAARRHSSAEALADELDRWLRGEPIHSRPVSSAERVAQWARRRPALASAIGALLVAITLGAGGVIQQWRRAAEMSHQRLLERYAADLQVASQALANHDLGLARRMVAAQLPSPGEADLRGLEWRLLSTLTRGQDRLALTGHTATVTCAAFFPDGSRAVSGGMDGSLRIWDLVSGKAIKNLQAHLPVVWSVAVTPEGDRIISSGSDGFVRFWTHDGEPAEAPLPGVNAALSADGRILAASASSPFKYMPAAGGLAVWDWRARRTVFQTNWAVRRVALSMDGGLLAAAGAERDIILWRFAGAEATRIRSPDVPWALDFSPNGRRLAAAGFGLGAAVFDLASNFASTRISGHKYAVWGAGFSPDGLRLATCGSDRTLQIQDAEPIDRRIILDGHDDEVWALAWSRDGHSLITASKDTSVRIWPAAPPNDGLEFKNTRYWRPVFSQDGIYLLTQDASPEGVPKIVLRNLANGRTEAEFAGQWAAAFDHASGNVLLVDNQDGAIHRWSLSRHQIISTTILKGAHLPMGIQTFCFARDGSALGLVVDRDAHVWRTSDGAPLAAPIHCPGEGIIACALSPGGRLLAMSSELPYNIIVTSLESGRSMTLTNHTELVKNLSFSSDGRLLASASVDRSIKIWNPSTGREVADLVRHVEEASDVDFTADGKTLASIGLEQAVKLWHLPTLRETVSIDLPDCGERIAVSPAGNAVAFTTIRDTVRILFAPKVERSAGASR